MFKSKTCAGLFLAAALVMLASCLAPVTASAATITWGTATTISADTDVNTNGTALYAYAGGVTTASTNVNGATFTAGSGFAAWGNVSFTAGFTAFNGTAFTIAASPFQDLTNNYKTVLVGAAYGGTAAGTVSLNGLTPGHDYSVQIWVNDPRAAGNGRTETITGSSVTLDYNNYDAAGGVGQYSIGVFAADSTNQSFALTPSASGTVQLNAISVRDNGLPIRTWLGSTDTSWGSAGNWSPAILPFPSDAILFNNLSTANQATVLDTSYTVSSLTLSNAPAISIGPDGNTLTINNGINYFGTSQSLGIHDSLVLGASQTWAVTNNGVLAIVAGVSGSANLTIAGGGEVILEQPATYTGNTILSGGKLIIGSAGTIASTNITIAGGATLDVSAESPNYVLNGSRLNNGSAGAVINGTSDCSSGTLSMLYDGVNSPFIQTNGTMTLSGGTVINVNNTGSVLGTGNHTIIAAAAVGNIGQVTGTLPSVNLTGNGAVGAVSLAINDSGGLDLVVGVADVWTGASDTSWLTAGNWITAASPNPGDPVLFNNLSTANLSTVLNADFFLAGVTVINPSGPVTIGGANNLGISASGFNLSSASQNLTITAPVDVLADQIWNITNSRALNINGGVSGNAAITVTGTGAVNFNSAASYTGNTTVSSGSTLKMTTANVLPNGPGTGNLNVSGSLDLNGNSEGIGGLNGSGIVDNTGVGAATLTIGANGGNGNFSGIIRNTGGALALQVDGGNVALLSTNTYSGGTTFNSGATLGTSTSYSLGTGPVTFNPGSKTYSYSMTFTNALFLDSCYLRMGGNNDSQIWSGPVTVTNGFQMSGDNGFCQLFLSGSMNIGTGGIAVTNSGNSGATGRGSSGLGDILSGPISGSGGITYYCNGGNSRITVQGANTYTGGTIVSGTGNGKLNIVGGSNPFSTGTVTLNAGANIEAYDGNATITNALTLAGGILESEPQYNNYNTLTWAGPITLTANSTILQGGTTTSTGNGNTDNQSSGVVVSGSLNINGFTLGSYGNFAFYGGNTINGPISGTGAIQVTNNALTISGSNTFSGTFRAVGGNLSVQNMYALQSATLDMNAADAGAVSITTNAIIGALTGSRDLNLGSYTVSIGNNNASTTFSGALTNSGSLVKVGSGTLTLSGATSFPGNTTVSNGTLSLSQSPFAASSTVKVAGGAFLNLNYSGTTIIQGLVLNGVSEPNGTYNSINSGGRITGSGQLQVNAPYAWVGSSSTSWNSTGNWAAGVVPGNGSNAVFNFYSTANLATVLNANFNLNTLTLANPSGPVSIAAGGAFALTLTNGIDMSAATQPLTITAPVVIGAPQTWTVASAINSLTVNGSVAGADLTVSGGGTVSLGGTNTYNGATTISSGTTLQISGAGQLGSSGNYLSNIIDSATLKYSSSANQTLSGTISGTGSLIKDTSSTSTLTIGALAASGRTSGNTTVSAGTLAVNSAGSLYSTSTYQANSTVTVNSGATLSLYAWAYSPAGSIGALDLAAARLKVNGGTIVYTGAGEGSGSANNGRLFTIGTGGATLDAEGTGTWFLEANSGYDGANGQVIPSSLTLTLTGAKNGRYDKPLSGAGSLVKSGAGIWTLTSTNSYAGNTTNSVGTLEADSSPSPLGVGLLVMNGGALSNSVSTILTNNINLAVNSSVGVGTSQTLTLGGVVTGAYSLNMNGPGTLVLSNTSSTYSGGTTITNGTLSLKNVSGFGTGPLTVNTGGSAYNFSTTAATITNAVTLNGGQLHTGGGNAGTKNTWSGPVTLTASSSVSSDGSTIGNAFTGGLNMGNSGYTFTVGGNGNNSGSANNFNSVISGGPNATFLVSGLAYLNAANTYSGTNRSGSSIVLQNVNALQNATLDMNTNDSGTVTLINNAVIGALTGGRNLNLSVSSISIGNNNASTTFSGALTNTGSITKIGTGTLTLTGTNTYTGNTTISNGTLLVNNTGGSGTGTGAVNINSGGTLAGTGAITGLVTNNAGGTLSPGVGGSGQFTLSGNVTLASGSTNAFAVNGSTPTNNSVALGAAVTYGGVLKIVTNGTFTVGQTFTLFSGAGATNASNFASIAGNPGSGKVFSFTNGVLSVVNSGPTLTSVVPNSVTGSSYAVTLGLTGSGFTGATAVLLTNVTAAAGSSYAPTVNSDTSITVTFVPGTAATTWNATVVNGTPSAQVGFTVIVPTKVNITGDLNAAGAGKLVLSGTGGVAGNKYAVQSATNLAPPVVWSSLVTNVFGAGGSFSYTNTVNPRTPSMFLRIAQ